MGCMDIPTHHNLLCSSNMSSSNGMYGHSVTSQSIVFVKYVIQECDVWIFRHITIYCVRQICHPVMGCMDIQSHHNLLCSSNMSSTNGMYVYSDTSQSIVFVKYVIQYWYVWTFRHITIYCVRQICHPVMGCMDIQSHHNLLCSSNMSSSNGMYGHSDTSQSIVFVKYVIQ